ncbi:Flp family type IVb pilin [bacterium (Candidatus Blackallbacteria) CG17_big_fil_post_rev_8_21_14_2_50_48_46]|uniref:Flp family type IVb pilin n=1 Tax=bacterium (Candidatus Blackallbacteria) CG17_big_fil_post_rev_8_21_14_2_50_48_46 TaxID=2014261 RepID=A0A2M7G993_9BACT|nr:MAG: Flp family type IVb pilin [bacterium (Candidatus Blackallbacteria) CG18_big_fil_WC_8_21_14_2_50_49_26]PIW18678.1 MAG: Flp family type IVb pilin [bacterium (Candidatus Blackallbacteria) CG17_big_fil_post_rev_8_21_14_2_50_48_46]PIW46336.1 MAG: Flp family type IVb pilin [bacterium (Candidatus Blackallbacteria) CG13_big_fil_rev_8_21_14_2_50_49_14]
MMNKVIALLKEEEGQSMVEYGIILALIAVVAIGTVQAIGQKLHSGDGTGAFDKVNAELGRVSGGSSGGTN